MPLRRLARILDVRRHEVRVLVARRGAQRRRRGDEIDAARFRRRRASAPYGSAAAAAMTGEDGRPSASSVIRTTRPSPQPVATSEPPSGATATWQVASPGRDGLAEPDERCLAGAAERLHGARRLERRVDDIEARVRARATTASRPRPTSPANAQRAAGQRVVGSAGEQRPDAGRDAVHIGGVPPSQNRISRSRS